MSDRYILNPDGPGRLDITPIVAGDPGPDLGDATMEAYKAQGDFGESVVDYRLPNRQMNFPLSLRNVGGTTFAQYRAKVQAWVARTQREGGILQRANAQGTASVKVVAAGLQLGAGVLQSIQHVDTNAVLEMEALPGWEEEEVELELHEETTKPELVFTETEVKGDIPAPCRVEVVAKQGQDQKGLIVAFRNRNYSSATTAKTVYAATEMGAINGAAKGTVSGATTGTAVNHGTLLPQWTPVLSTNLNGTAFLTHQGTYRVFARMRSPQGTAVSARFVWDVGDLVYPTENPAWQFPGGSAWFVADLGEVRLDAPPVGAHRWQGQIQAKGTEGGEDINIDRVWIVSTDETMGKLSSPPQVSTSSWVITAWDNFDVTAAGTLTGKVAPLGGTWTANGSGMDAVGFTVGTAFGGVYREEKGDSSATAGYAARLGAGTATLMQAQVDVLLGEGLTGDHRCGLFVRSSGNENKNLFRVSYCWPKGGTYGVVYKEKVVGGTIVFMGLSGTPPPAGWRTLKVVISSEGDIWVYEGTQGGELQFMGHVRDADFATGGTLASGGYGIYDAYAGSEEGRARYYDNFYVYTASLTPEDAVLFASQKAQFTTEGSFRLDAGGTAYGPISRSLGDLPRLPAGGTTEVFVKASRGDLDQVSDSGVDDIAARVYYRPTWLTFPE